MTVVLITGAGQGLGREVAGQLAAQATVVITASDPEKAKQTATELDVHALGVGLDVSDDASVHEAAAAFERESRASTC